MSRGLSASPTLVDIGYDFNVDKAPERISLTHYCTLLAYCAEKLQDPLFGFHLGQAIRTADYGILGYLVETSENLEQAIEALLKYDSLVADIGETQFFVRQHEAVIRWQPYTPTNSHVVLRNMTAWVATARQLIAHDLNPSALFLTETLTSSDRMELQQWFGCDVKSNQSYNELRFPLSFLTLSFTTENRFMHENLRLLSEQELSKQESLPAYLSRLKQILQLKSDLHACSLTTLAEALNTTPRTVQRKLRQEGTSFRQLLDEERKSRAQRLINTQPLGSLATILGFDEQSSFNRAFRRWFGCSPSEFKRHTSGD